MEAAMERSELVGLIRNFNRFYTRTVGLLEETLSQSAFTLTEARVIFEIGHRAHGGFAPDIAGERGFLARTFQINVGAVASDIARDLRLDPAYLTRILKKFAAANLVEMSADPADGRRRMLSLTRQGRAALAGLQAAADRDIGRLVEPLPDASLPDLAGALRKVTSLLAQEVPHKRQTVLRPHRSGDIGWVVQRQSLLYTREFGWTMEFEALVAEIGAKFLRNFLEGRDYCWIAELDGEPVGAIFLVHDESDPDRARLRMLHVEASARGRGVGSMLVEACIDKARAFGYRRLELWTNDILHEARRIYERAGFRLLAEEPHHSFGKDLVGQTWELQL
jgi:DNA-binding MarR family transcriptional regulator/GNAT superfamily N-acetyltransferase